MALIAEFFMPVIFQSDTVKKNVTTEKNISLRPFFSLDSMPLCPAFHDRAGEENKSV